LDNRNIKIKNISFSCLLALGTINVACEEIDQATAQLSFKKRVEFKEAGDTNTAAAMYMPPASAQRNDVTIQPGPSIVNDLNATILKIDSPYRPIGGAKYFGSIKSFPSDILEQSTIALPMPTLKSPEEQLVVFYHVQDPQQAGYKKGIFIEDQFIIENGMVNIPFQGFGTYQLASLSNPLAASTKVDTITVSIPQSDLTVLTPAQLTKAETVFDPPNKVSITTRQEGFSKISACIFTLKENQVDTTGITIISNNIETDQKQLRASLETILNPELQYIARVVCEESNGRTLSSPWSDPFPETAKSEPNASEKTSDSPPTANEGGQITATGITETSMNLSWENATDDITAVASLKYQVMISQSDNIDTVTKAGVNGEVAATYQTANLNHTLTGLNPKTTYFINVLVKDGSGNRGLYKTLQVITLNDSTAPIAGGIIGKTLYQDNITFTTIGLRWESATDNTTATNLLSYEIYYSQSPMDESVSAIESNTAFGSPIIGATTAIVNGLTMATPYYLGVIVSDTNGNRSAYSVVSFTTEADNTPPTAGAGSATTLTATNTTNSTTAVSWNLAIDDYTSQGQLSYSLYYSTTSLGSNVPQVEAGVAVSEPTSNISSQSISGLAPDTTYYFNVVVEDTAGNKSIYTELSLVTSSDTLAPTAGGNQGANILATSRTENSVTLSWLFATDDISQSSSLKYSIYYKVASSLGATVSEVESNGLVVTTDKLNINSYTAADLNADSSHYFNVVVKDEAGNKSIYNELNVSTLPDTNAPRAGGDLGNELIPISVQETGFTIIWNHATDDLTKPENLFYEVHCSTTQGFAVEDDTKITSDQNINTATINTLSPETNYYCRVLVEDLAGNRSFYSELDQQTLADTTSPEPGSSGVLSATNITTTGLTLTWASANDSISHVESLQYEVRRSISNNIDNIADAETNGILASAYTINTNTFTSTDLTPGTVYYFNVIVSDEAGNKSAYTSLMISTNEEVAPPEVTNLTATSTAASITLSWSSGGGTTTGFYIKYQEGDTPPNNCFTPNLSVGVLDSYKVVGLSSATNYSFRICSVNGNQTPQISSGLTSAPITTQVFDPTKGALSVSLGSRHTCGLDIKGSAYCWGNNNNGQLGNTTTIDKNTPTKVESNNLFATIKLGGAHTCGLQTTGQALCWGDNAMGQLGDNTTIGQLIPSQTYQGSGEVFTQLSLGKSHTCALNAAGKALCWGSNESGQIGNNQETEKYTTPQYVDGDAAFVSINSGNDHNCGIKVDGKAYCWGRNDRGQVGNNATADKQIKPELVDGGHFFTKLSLGESHTCALDAAGFAHCWGANTKGQIGDDTNNDRWSPTQITASDSNFYGISLGQEHSCAINQNGEISCWGAYGKGQTGTGNNTEYVLTPTAVFGNHSFTAVSAGGNSSCGLKIDGAVYCWGSNLKGQLGDNSGAEKHLTPVAIETNLLEHSIELAQITAGNLHTCGLKLNGKAYCWGRNMQGQLGIGFAGPHSHPKPIQVVGGPLFKELSLGDTHSCGLTVEGDAYCWGYNQYGQVGNGATTFDQVNAISLVSGNHKFGKIASGYRHTCGLKTTGEAFCWGRNDNGQLGNNSSIQQNSPQLVMTQDSFINITLGNAHTCGLTAKGKAFCWGFNGSGQLGNNSTTNKAIPTNVETSETFLSIRAGDSHTCAINEEYSIYCWGANSSGQLGIGSTEAKQTPSKINSNEQFLRLELGGYHSCALTAAGQVYCWGANSYSQLGVPNLNLTFITTPTSILQNSFISISLGSNHTCGLKIGGAAYCWGQDSEGQGGNGWEFNGGISSLPTPVNTSNLQQ